MKQKTNLLFISLIFLISIANLAESKNIMGKAKNNKMTPKDFYLTSKYKYKIFNRIKLILALLFQNSNQDIKTQLKPDNDSSALKLSKEELGRYTW